ncbi:MAG: hypothetical protein ACRELY_32410 [Polyangiaceae bacterium]
MKHVKYICLFAVLSGFFDGCATLGNVTPPDDALPSSGAGPFRKLSSNEVQGVAPFVLDDAHSVYREPSALPLDGSNADGTSPTMRVALYFVAKSKTIGHDVIVRTHADDARSFYGAPLDIGHFPQEVLAADQAWEGDDLAGPSVLASNGTIYLYYATIGGIGLARSNDGFAFAKEQGPIFTSDSSASWENETPRAPSVAILPTGEFRMLYNAGFCIGEASSTDGVHFTRLDADPTTPALDPVLCPDAAVSDEAVDAGATRPIATSRVDDPVLFPRTTPAGRLQFRVLYTGYTTVDGTPSSAIGFAARYGDSGPLVKNSGAVYAAGKNEHAPAIFAWQAGELLYVTQDDTPSSGPAYPAIAGAFAPGQDTLPTPNGYADSP